MHGMGRRLSYTCVYDWCNKFTEGCKVVLYLLQTFGLQLYAMWAFATLKS